MSNIINDLGRDFVRLLKTIGTVKSAVAGAFAIWIFLKAYLDSLEHSEIAVLTILAFAVMLYVLDRVKLDNLKFPRSDKREDRTYNVLETYFSKKSIRVIDFIDTKTRPIIEEKVFEDCVISGPVVLALQGSASIKNSTFSGALELMMIEVEVGRVIQGIVGIKNCTFSRCRFENVSFIGTKEVLAHISAGIA